MKDRIFESKENYLETILILHDRNGEVRSVDIAAEMEFSKPSVSVAMKNLREEGCISVDKNGYITLTKRGREIAERVYERHLLFTSWLTSMGVPEDIAAEDACRIEHCLSAESFAAIKDFVRKHGQETP
ncbi:MAG: metal-dependent transcriptional regulator [Oscillospiraceae bacterium]|nr:metal-dependent transcriptional regulator [Oscillospiraceae bacterium]